jgi:hypothetical protein
MKEISTYGQLLEYAFDLLDRTKSFEPAQIKDGLDCSIKIKGKSWDGLIDWRIARLVLDIQESVNKAFKEAGIDLSREESEIFAVKFKISKGCSLIEIQPGKAIQALLDKMTGTQKTALGIVLILAATAYLSHGQYLDYKAKLEAKTQDEATKRELMLLTKDVLAKIDEHEKPVRGLIAKLHDKDLVTIPSSDQELTKKQIKEEYPNKQRSKPETVYIDDTYIINSIKYPGDSVRIIIEKGSQRIDCGVALSGDDLAALYNKAKEQHGEGEGFEMPLKITAKFTKGGGIKEAVIFGLGDPRDGVIKLAQLFPNGE